MDETSLSFELAEMAKPAPRPRPTTATPAPPSATANHLPAPPGDDSGAGVSGVGPVAAGGGATGPGAVVAGGGAVPGTGGGGITAGGALPLMRRSTIVILPAAGSTVERADLPSFVASNVWLP